MTISVTLDTNVAFPVANHVLKKCSVVDATFAKLAKGVISGAVKPFVSAASFSFELLPRQVRVLGVLTHFALLPQYRCLAKARIPVPALNRIRDYLDAGLRVLHAHPRAALRPFVDLPPDAWASDERFSRSERLDRQKSLVERFEPMGPERLKHLGARMATIHDLDRTHAEEQLGRSVSASQLWVDGLIAEVVKPRAHRSEGEALGVIRKLLSDWFDLDSVASHYGYGLDCFCTKDRGRGKGSFEILHPDNRERLRSEFAVEIVSPDDLVEKL